ncbi:hypothetical protein BKH46_04090 [Helicobacter sp. 12S02634-8]|nr:hypothetical protein BKH46_04090 [Helicobacter sp. 12S02634-8]
MLLIEGVREWVFFIGLFVLVFAYSVGEKYRQFSQLDFSKPQEIYAQVVLQYPKSVEKTLKNGTRKIEHYFVLKLSDTNNNIFYTTSKEDLKSIANRYIRLYGQIQKCSFLQFFKSCYVFAYSISLLHKRDYRDTIRDFIDKQHAQAAEGASAGNLYRALFIADPLDKQWRDVSNKLGLAHIIAISGFHLGVLSGVFYLVFAPLYRYCQHRYFPYRNEAYDLGALILILMFGYLLILDYQPSFFRSFVMAVLGFLIYYSGIRLLSFSLLFFVCLFCIALFPSLLINIGFILSVAGVFYIFLFIKHCPKMHKIFYAILFNFAIFFNIAPIVHYFFPYFTPYQLISIPVSIAFIVFFPLSLGLHALGFGGVMDKFLLQGAALNPPFIEYYAPGIFVLAYVGLSLCAIYSKKMYVLLNLWSIGFFIVLLWRYL